MDLTTELGRIPVKQEIADKMGIPVSKLILNHKGNSVYNKYRHANRTER